MVRACEWNTLDSEGWSLLWYKSCSRTWICSSKNTSNQSMGAAISYEHHMNLFYNWIVVHQPYCWWLKSCTSWYVVDPIIYKVLYIPGGAGFLPSTVSPIFFKVPSIWKKMGNFSSEKVAGGKLGTSRIVGGMGSAIDEAVDVNKVFKIFISPLTALQAKRGKNREGIFWCGAVHGNLRVPLPNATPFYRKWCLI